MNAYTLRNTLLCTYLAAHAGVQAFYDVGALFNRFCHNLYQEKND